jgi:hypothetical protein
MDSSRLAFFLVVFGFVLTGCSPSPDADLKRSDTTVEITRLKQGWQPMGVEINEGDQITFAMQGRIEFDWLYNQLPALASETDAATHDYMSIAVEFDNGRDITWMWSRDLPEDTHFECPLPEWIGREWHYVLQTGNDDLGNWYHHDRPILEDYRRTIPGEVPTRIVAVWFIADSLRHALVSPSAPGGQT